MTLRLGLSAAVALMGSGLAAAMPVQTILGFDALSGWAEDDHAAALGTFRETCQDLDGPDWQALCAIAGDVEDPRAFFELFFVPVLIDDGAPALFTGYFEPELAGSRTPNGRFRYPIYSRPPDLGDEPWLTRREIEERAALAGRGLEIAWLDDPVDLFFLQIQGSGRIRLAGGEILRVGYGGANLQPYTSIGQELVRRGVFDPHEVSADVIRAWVRDNPEAGQDLLWQNRSYVFFREIEELPAHRGPVGAMNRSLTAGRTIAADPSYVPLGAPVWIETEGQTPMRRLMVAQDTGAAIKGAQRADIFFGTGREAGREAGRVRDGGRMVVLLPVQRAYAMAAETLE